jgi:hypothetical protein
VSSHTGNAALPPKRETAHYQRKETAPQQEGVKQGTGHPKTDTHRDQQAISAGKKKNVTFGDSGTEEEKHSGKHAPTAGGVTSAAKTSTLTSNPTQ